MASEPRWWDFRRAQNLTGAVYRCPFCEGSIPALLEHMLVIPEGNPARRRHAHTDCAKQAREAGTLPTRDEWEATLPASGRRWWQFWR